MDGFEERVDSNQSSGLCGHRMRTSLGLEPRPLSPQEDIPTSQGVHYHCGLMLPVENKL